MSFTLSIATSRDRGTQTSGYPARVEAESASVATLLASGPMDAVAADRVIGECARLFGEGADTVIIDLSDLSAGDESVYARLAGGITSEREQTHHLFVRCSEVARHAALAACDDAAAWLMPLEGTAGDSARRNITTHTPLHPDR